MKVIDPGHEYELATLDGDVPVRLTFVKREGEGYPGNVGHYAGVNIQEVCRVLLDRLAYLDNQIPCMENKMTQANLRSAILWLEIRAARRHGRELKHGMEGIELVPPCPKCGHIECTQHEEVASANAAT